jgi:hypothetical protein
VTAAAFARDVARLLGDPVAARTAAELVARTVERDFSLVPMAIDMEGIYRRQLARSR